MENGKSVFTTSRGGGLFVVLALLVALVAPAVFAGPAGAANGSGSKAVSKCAKGKKVAFRKKCRNNEVRLKATKKAVKKVNRAGGKRVLCYKKNGSVFAIKGGAAKCKKRKMTYLKVGAVGPAGARGPAGATGATGATGPQGPAGQSGIGSTKSPMLMRGTAYADYVGFAVMDFDPDKTYSFTTTSGTPTEIAECTFSNWDGIQEGLDGCARVDGLAPETTVTMSVTATAPGKGTSLPTTIRMRTAGVRPAAPTATGASWTTIGGNRWMQIDYTSAEGSDATRHEAQMWRQKSNGDWKRAYGFNCRNADGKGKNVSGPCYIDVRWIPDGVQYKVAVSAQNQWGDSGYSNTVEPPFVPFAPLVPVL